MCTPRARDFYFSTDVGICTGNSMLFFLHRTMCAELSRAVSNLTYDGYTCGVTQYGTLGWASSVYSGQIEYNTIYERYACIVMRYFWNKTCILLIVSGNRYHRARVILYFNEFKIESLCVSEYRIRLYSSVRAFLVGLLLFVPRYLYIIYVTPCK